MHWLRPPADGAAVRIEGPAAQPMLTSGLWYRAPLSDATIGPSHVAIVGQHFAETLGVSGWPDGACLFLCVGDALYFSPAAIAAVPYLIVACGAQPSPPPDRARATLLVGRQSDWTLLPYEQH